MVQKLCGAGGSDVYRGCGAEVVQYGSCMVLNM